MGDLPPGTGTRGISRHNQADPCMVWNAAVQLYKNDSGASLHCDLLHARAIYKVVQAQSQVRQGGCG